MDMLAVNLPRLAFLLDVSDVLRNDTVQDNFPGPVPQAELYFVILSQPLERYRVIISILLPKSLLALTLTGKVDERIRLSVRCLVSWSYVRIWYYFNRSNLPIFGLRHVLKVYYGILEVQDVILDSFPVPLLVSFEVNIEENAFYILHVNKFIIFILVLPYPAQALHRFDVVKLNHLIDWDGNLAFLFGYLTFLWLQSKHLGMTIEEILSSFARCLRFNIHFIKLI